MKITKAARIVRKSLRKKAHTLKNTVQAHPVEQPESLSTGCSLLNIAISDDPNGGLLPGKYYFLVGDSASGKTFLSMTCFAEAMLNPAFQHYRLILDNVEDGALMDVGRFFGSKVADRVESPGAKGQHSETIEDFYYHLDDAIKTGKPFIYVLDSMDSLTSEDEDAKFSKVKEAARAGKESTGSYGDGKAKKNSAGIRRALRGLRKTGSILIVICQTRDNLGGGGPWAPKKTRSGGRALRFYATVELWTSKAGGITKTVNGKARKIGDTIKVKVEKNRITGKLHEIETAIYPSIGIDDVGSCVDYLVAEKWWKKKGQLIHAKEIGSTASRDKLIKLCETKRKKLLRAVKSCWRKVQDTCQVERKRRYV